MSGCRSTTAPSKDSTIKRNSSSTRRMDSAPPRTTSAIATPLANVTVEEANLNLQNFELFGIGRLGDPTQGRGTFDVLAGARYRGLSSDLSVSLPIVGTIGPFSGDRSWWDLLLGGALHEGPAPTDIRSTERGCRHRCLQRAGWRRHRACGLAPARSPVQVRQLRPRGR